MLVWQKVGLNETLANVPDSKEKTGENEDNRQKICLL